MRRLPGLVMVPLSVLLALAPFTLPQLTAVPASAAPPGDPSVSIQSLTGGIDTTTSIAVRLALSWPTGADQVTVDNGDGAAQTRAVADTLDWQLLPVDNQEAAAVLTVTYTGPGLPPTTRSDTILLDTRAPRVPLQRLYANGDGWFLAVGAQDAGTGVRSIVLLGKTGKPLQGAVVCEESSCPATALETFFADRARPRVARVTDAAGLSKTVQVVRRATRCSLPDGRYPVFTAEPGFHDCVEAGDRCRRDDGHFWSQSAYARCRQGHVRIVDLPPTGRG